MIYVINVSVPENRTEDRIEKPMQVTTFITSITSIMEEAVLVWMGS